MSRASITKTVRGLQRLGLSVCEVVVTPDGTVRVLTAPANEGVDDELEAMREARRARSPNRTAQGH